jgi:hypothetical protein
VLLPLVVLSLWYSYRGHRRPLPLALGLAAAAIAYLHILAGTPEWTMFATAGLGILAAVLDWRAGTRWGRACPVPEPRAAGSGVRRVA